MAKCSFAPWADPDEKPLIEFQNVTKSFGSFAAIDDLEPRAFMSASFSRFWARQAAAKPP